MSILLGYKIGMTQIFTENGDIKPVTIIKAGPCPVTQIKTLNIDGYNSVQIGFQEIQPNQITKPELGHLKKTNSSILKYLKEYRVKDHIFKIGENLNVNMFKLGDFVNITGNSIGKGFSGNQKRNNFKRGPMTHGSKNHRAPGSIGQSTTPGRVFPGKRMAGRLGGTKTTISNLQILNIIFEDNLLIAK